MRLINKGQTIKPFSTKPINSIFLKQTKKKVIIAIDYDNGKGQLLIEIAKSVYENELIKPYLLSIEWIKRGKYIDDQDR